MITGYEAAVTLVLALALGLAVLTASHRLEPHPRPAGENPPAEYEGRMEHKT